MEASSFRRQAPGRAYDFLPPEPAARQQRRPRPADISDAEFVTVGPARVKQSQQNSQYQGAQTPPPPPPRPETRGFDARSFNDNRRNARAAAAGPAPVVMAAASSVVRVVEGWLQRASITNFVVLVMALFVLVFSAVGGFSGFSGSSAAYSGSPLNFTHVTVTPREANGMRILTVNGIIENNGGTTQTVRPIRADVFTDDRLTASIVINPPADVIYAGQSRGFSARLQHAGTKMPEVRLSFMP